MVSAQIKLQLLLFIQDQVASTDVTPQQQKKRVSFTLEDRIYTTTIGGPLVMGSFVGAADVPTSFYTTTIALCPQQTNLLSLPYKFCNNSNLKENWSQCGFHFYWLVLCYGFSWAVIKKKCVLIFFCLIVKNKRGIICLL